MKVGTLKVREFKPAPVGDKGGIALRVTRQSISTAQPLQLADFNALTTSDVLKSVSSVASKLGLSDLQVEPPSLSVETASEHSQSFEAVPSTSSPLSSVPEDFDEPESEDLFRLTTSEDMIIPKHSDQPLCPFCKESVDKEFLEEHINIKQRLSIRQQAQFCKAHKRRAAEEEWRRRQYPVIDWPKLHEQMEKFHHVLDDVLQQRKSSFYRNAFEDLVKARKNKTGKAVRADVLDANRIEELIPGYYGSRGARIMCVNHRLMIS